LYGLWDDETGVSLNVLRGHSAPLNSIAFDPGGRFLISGGLDMTVRVWDLQTAPGALYAELNGHSGSVTSVAFSPDGRTMISGSRDMTAILWLMPAPPQEIERWARGNRYWRQLTCAERQLFLVQSTTTDTCADEG